MAVMEFSRECGSWAKTCPRCKVAFKGHTGSWQEGQDSLMPIFGRADRQADGMQALCKMCAKERRRERNGVNDTYDENKMYAEQDGKCALCTIELHLPYRYSADAQGARVDHDHKTGKVRGLLCHRCNSMIGMFEATLEVFPEFDLTIIDKYIAKGQ
jgi:hypothetical protein